MKWTLKFYLEVSSCKEYGCVVHLEFTFYSLILQKLQNGAGQNHRAELRTSVLFTPNQCNQVNSGLCQDKNM